MSEERRIILRYALPGGRTWPHEFRHGGAKHRVVEG